MKKEYTPLHKLVHGDIVEIIDIVDTDRDLIGYKGKVSLVRDDIIIHCHGKCTISTSVKEDKIKVRVIK